MEEIRLVLDNVYDKSLFLFVTKMMMKVTQWPPR